MRKILFLVLAGSLAFAPRGWAGPVGPQDEPHPKTYVPKAPLQVTIAMLRPVFSLGESIPVTVFYKNRTDQYMKILGLTVWAYPLTFEVRDKDGQTSVTCKAPREKHKVDYAQDFVILSPGETLMRVYDLNQFYDFKTPGIYYPTAIYSGSWGLPETKSKTIKFQLIQQK